MADHVSRAFAAWVVGSLLIGLALTLIGFAWWWTFARERFSWPLLVVRGGLGVIGLAILWLGLIVAGIGTESFLGNPLGRWSGAHMVPMLWLCLEVLVRDQAMVAGLAERDLGTSLVHWWPRGLHVLAKGMLVLSGLTVLWAWFGV